MHSYSIKFKMLICVFYSGLAALYFLLSFVIDLPAVKNVLGAVMILIFILSLYFMRTTKYGGEVVTMVKPSGVRLFSLELNEDPNDIWEMEEILFKVVEKPFSEYEDMD